MWLMWLKPIELIRSVAEIRFHQPNPSSLSWRTDTRAIGGCRRHQSDARNYDIINLSPWVLIAHYCGKNSLLIWDHWPNNKAWKIGKRGDQGAGCFVYKIWSTISVFCSFLVDTYLYLNFSNARPIWRTSLSPKQNKWEQVYIFSYLFQNKWWTNH